MALQVHVDDRIPLGLVHVEAHLVAQDARVVDEHVEATERVDGLLHHLLGARPRGDAVVVRGGAAARGGDLVDDLLRRCRVGAVAVGASAEVVDDDRRAFGGEQQRVTTADAAPGAGDDGDLAVEQTHDDLLID